MQIKSFFYLQIWSEQLYPDQFLTHLIITSICKPSMHQKTNNICHKAVVSVHRFVLYTALSTAPNTMVCTEIAQIQKKNVILPHVFTLIRIFMSKFHIFSCKTTTRALYLLQARPFCSLLAWLELFQVHIRQSKLKG